MPIEIINGNNLDHIILGNGESSLTVYYYGANITSWKYKGFERLFTSSKANLSGPKAIRGGIPIVFPQFGPEALHGYKALPQHGFARLVCWEFQGVKCDSVEKTEISFLLKNTMLIPEAQQSIWNHDFKLIYTITLQANTLKTNLEVHNTGASDFTFTTLLHTYLKVDNVEKLAIKGLSGYKFKEFSHDYTESRNEITIAKETDRVYQNAATSAITLDNTVAGKSLVLTKSPEFKDVVVWNPWVDNAKKMADFGDEEYMEMVCVEAGALEPIVLAPGKAWEAHQVLVAL